MVKVCKHCNHTFNEVIYPTDLNVQLYSTDCCTICNSDISKTMILNAILNDPIVCNFLYSTLINRHYGENTVEVPEINEM